MADIDYSKICFVIMPFGKKTVDNMEINFDAIYDNIFEPAIAAVVLPEGGTLIPKRTDKDYFSANIDTEMFLYLEYSRIAFVDITGLNANVFYELGVRHHAKQSGTAIFRQTDKMPPFDISHIKALPYEYEPVDSANASKALITRVLTDSLEYNRIDSPIQVALTARKLMSATETGNIEQLLKDATNAMRNDDLITALNKYKQAIALDPKNHVLYLESGLLLKGLERWKDAANAFAAAKNLSPLYSEAWRELGIAENKLFNKEGQNPANPTGESSLIRAIELNPDDFDALASLGGVYKRLKMYDRAAEMYGRSLEVSNGHPYPLLNAIILQVREQGYGSITGRQRAFMKRGEITLKKQVTDTPPYNAPWSFFDLSTIYLLNDNPESLTVIMNIPVAVNNGDYQTHLNTLELIKDVNTGNTLLKEIIEYLKDLTS